MTRDLQELIKAVAFRGNERWRTRYGAFLDLLQRFAAEGKIREIATACSFLCEIDVAARPRVTSALPAILFSNHKPLVDGVDFSKFLAWKTRCPE